MGVFDLFKQSKADKQEELADMLDFTLLDEAQERVYMKKLALTTVVDYVARIVGQCQFRIEPGSSAMRYRLQVKPNANQDGPELLRDVSRQMLQNGAALIVQVDDKQLLVADDYERNEYPLRGDTFTGVTAGPLTFGRTFQRSDVFYIPYSNEALDKLATDLLKDYGSLFGRTIENQKRKNQLRARVKIDSTFSQQEDSQKKLQAFVDRIYQRIYSRSVALLPEQKGIEYEEISKQVANGTTDGVAELVKIAEDYLAQIARAVGVPPVLLLGGQADLSDARTALFRQCIDPLLQTIENEFNRQLWTQEEYLAGNRVTIVRPPIKDLFELSGAIDKLIGGHIATPNQLREKAGLPRDETSPGMDDYYLTKNYARSDQVNADPGGGETNASND